MPLLPRSHHLWGAQSHAPQLAFGVSQPWDPDLGPVSLLPSVVHTLLWVSMPCPGVCSRGKWGPLGHWRWLVPTSGHTAPHPWVTVETTYTWPCLPCVRGLGAQPGGWGIAGLMEAGSRQGWGHLVSGVWPPAAAAPLDRGCGDTWRLLESISTAGLACERFWLHA